MQVKRLVLGPLAANCYLLTVADLVLVIDPGDEANRLLTYLKDQGLSLEKVVLTHAHADHCAAAGRLRKQTGARILLHERDRELAADAELNLSTMTDPGGGWTLTADQLLGEGEEIAVAGYSLTVLHSPGHTPGSICLRSGDRLFTGDTLFAGSAGRTDLPQGSPHALTRSLKRLAGMEDHLQVYPGHGEPTTLGREKRVNPFLAVGV